MQVIDMKRGAPRRIVAMSYGASGAGKTRFAATWPRPIFLSDARERGWETIRNMNPESFYEADRPPVVWALEEQSDFLKGIDALEKRVKKNPGEFETVVIDSLTLYSDFYFLQIYSEAARSAGKLDTRKLYGTLGQHIQWIQDKVHLLPLNVLWLALEKPISEDNPVGMPLLTGQIALKAPAKCDYLFYHRCYQEDRDSPPRWEIRTKPYQNHYARGRDGDYPIPDPLEPNFRALEAALGINR